MSLVSLLIFSCVTEEQLDADCFFCDGPHEAEKGKRPYCEKDFVKLFCPKCADCGQPIIGDYAEAHGTPDSKIEIMICSFAYFSGRAWHPEHLACAVCQKRLGGEAGEEVCLGSTQSEPDTQATDGDEPKRQLVYCSEHWASLFGSLCAGCGEVIDHVPLEAVGKQWHNNDKCFACVDCGKPLVAGEQFYSEGGKPYCKDDFLKSHCTQCALCGSSISPEEQATSTKVQENHYHAGCLKCFHCGQLFGPGTQIREREGKLYVRVVVEVGYASLTNIFMKVLCGRFHKVVCRCSAMCGMFPSNREHVRERNGQQVA